LPRSAAIAFPASIALPPPQATTSSGSACRARAQPRRTSSIVGSLVTANVTLSTDAAASRSRAAAARAGVRPVTTSAWRPSERASGPSSSSVPGPNTMRVAVANSNLKAAFRNPCRRAKG
jgi:hypothetical protein